MTKTEEALQRLLGDTALALNDSADESVAAKLNALADELPGLRAAAAKCEEMTRQEVERRKLALFDKGAARGAFCNAQKSTLLKLALEDLEELESETPDGAAFPSQRLPQPAEGKTADELTPEEKEMARKMNLSDEEFLAVKKKLETENEEDK